MVGRLSWLAGLVILAGAMLTGCGSPSPEVATVPFSEPAATGLPLAAEPPTSGPLPATIPPATLGLPSPTPSRSPRPTAISRPTVLPPTLPATATVDPGAGLPCPPVNPIKPDYVRGGVGPEVWATADPSWTTPHLWLADPVAVDVARLNRTFPYGSDGSGRYLLHNGLDIVEPPDTPVLAVADGTVIVAGPDAERLYGWRCDWYGNLVVVELDQTWDGQPIYVLYGHVLEVGVAVGQRVQQGDPLAVIGVGGVATAPHLHLEVRAGENTFSSTRNPALWLRSDPGYGVVAGRLVDPDGRPWQGVTMTLIDPTGVADFLNTWTYLDDPEHLIRPDEALGENFAWAAIPAGEYDVFTRVQDRDYRRRIVVVEGQVTLVEIVTDPYLTPAPAALATP